MAEQQQETAHCSPCRQPLRARKNAERVVETRVGPISLSRPYFYCGTCRKGFSPLDEALDVAPRRKQLDLQRAMVRVTKEVPSETASEWCEELTGLSVSTHTAHAVTTEVAEGLGGLEVSPSSEDMAARIAEVAHGKPQPPIVGLGIDSAQGPTRPETATDKRPGRKNVRATRARWQGA